MKYFNSNCYVEFIIDKTFDLQIKKVFMGKIKKKIA